MTAEGVGVGAAMGLDAFRAAYPANTMTLSNGAPFTYRFHRNPESTETLVLLTGGIGLSDLFYLHFERFAREFSVLTCDYQTRFGTIAEFADALAEVLRRLGEQGGRGDPAARAWLVGQSLGGIVAQVAARRHPDVVAGLVLSNTCSLSARMAPEAREYLEGMIANQKRSRRLLELVPFALYKRLVVAAVMKKARDLMRQEQALIRDLCGAMRQMLTRDYALHMTDFLIDSHSYWDMEPADFARWDDRVLLLLSSDDHTFDEASKDALVSIMPRPTIVTDITGGHLALIVRLDRYAETVSSYVHARAHRPGT